MRIRLPELDLFKQTLYDFSYVLIILCTLQSILLLRIFFICV